MIKTESIKMHGGTYKTLGRIGEGSFACVYKALHDTTGVIVAIKVIRKSAVNCDDADGLWREVSLLKSIDHPFIASFFETYEDETNYYISMEYMENGNLLDFINGTGELPIALARRLFLELALALDYLHQTKHICHRDLKPENIMLDRNYDIKLVDFGLSRRFTSNNPMMITSCGSPCYVSPEIINQQPYSSSTDIWALGVLLYSMIMGKLPFFDANLTVLFDNIVNMHVELPKDIPEDLRDLIEKLLEKDPRQRITIQEILLHRWLKFSPEYNIYRTFNIYCTKTAFLNDNKTDLSIVHQMGILGIDTYDINELIARSKMTCSTVTYKILKRRNLLDQPLQFQNSSQSKDSIKFYNKRTISMFEKKTTFTYLEKPMAIKQPNSKVLYKPMSINKFQVKSALYPKPLMK